MASNQNDTKERKLEYFYQLNSVMPLFRIASVSILIIMGVLVIDILNIPSLLFEKAPEQLIQIVFVSVVMLAVLWMLEHSYFQAFTLKTVTHIDAAIICLFTSSLILRIIYSIIVPNSAFKSKGTLIIMIVALCMIVFRVHRCKCKQNLNEHLYDLKDILNNNFTVLNDEPILLSEKDVDYDLLDRSTTINQLYSTIINFRSERSFVIALCGEWGSGKTTIINNVKRLINENNREAVVIDDFDPWIFGTRDALLLSMYDKILQKTGIKYSVLKSKRIASCLKQTFGDIGNTITKSKEIGSLFKELTSPNSSSDQITTIKAELTMYLNSLNKPIVFIIDNIDRAEADNILFLFKLIGTIFDLPNILYILSYDSNRVKELINNTAKIHPKYIEKIVQQEIQIPSAPKEHLAAVYQICTQNILQRYGIDFMSNRIYTEVCNVLCSDGNENIRNFKRLVNSVYSNVLPSCKRLDTATLFSLEAIRFIVPELYEQIRTNQEYFISRDTILSEEKIRINYYNREQFNKKGKAYYDQLSDKYSRYLPILSLLFPYASRYIRHEELMPQYSYDSDSFNSKYPIYSAKFFDLYFSYGSNEFSIICESVENMIASINNSEKKKARTILKKYINEIDTNWQREWFETLQLYTDEILDSRKYALTKAIWWQLDSIDNGLEFMMLSAHQRALIIIAILIKQMKAEEVSDFYRKLGNKYQWVLLISDLIYWMEVDNKHSTSDNKWIDDLRTIYANMCNKIIEEKVHLYDSAYYRYKNIYGILRFFCGEKNTIDDREVCKQYIQNTFLDEYVYRLLADCITTSRSGNVYGYTIQADSDLLQFVDKIRIDEAIQQRPPRSDIEKIVLNLYQEYCVTGHDVENQYYSSTPLKFKL